MVHQSALFWVSYSSVARFFHCSMFMTCLPAIGDGEVS